MGQYTETFWCLYFSGLREFQIGAPAEISLPFLLRRNPDKRLVNHFRSLFQ